MHRKINILFLSTFFLVQGYASDNNIGGVIGGIGGDIIGNVGGDIIGGIGGGSGGGIIGGIGGGIIDNILGNSLGSLFDDFNKITGGAVGMCYYNGNTNNVDICSQLNVLNGLQQNMCSILPDLGAFGFSKKTNNIGISSIALQQYCSATIEQKLNNMLNNMSIYDSMYSSNNTTLPNGKSNAEYYNSVANPRNIFQSNSQSAIKNAILSGNQESIRMLVETGKSSNNLSSLNNLDTSKIKAPSTITDYNNQRDGLAASVTNDLIVSSPSNISGVLSQKLSGKKGTQAEMTANSYVTQINSAIDAGTPKRIGLAIDNARLKDDIAIPTQDYVQLIRADQQPQVIYKIQQQIKREAQIQSQIVLQDSIRKNLVSLSAQKAVIMNEQFDKNKAEQEINKLLK